MTLQRQIGPHGGFLCAEEFGCILWVTGKLLMDDREV